MAQWIRGLAAVTALFGLAAGGVALARGPNMDIGGGNPFFGNFFGAQRYEAPRPVRYEADEPRPAARRHAPRTAAVGYGKSVCVRLCDGFFFPTASASGGDSACASQCPDAPTALYTMPADKIEDAISTAGVLYSKLPVAKRYQTNLDSTCTCHRDVVASRAKELLADPTLRKGDVVMTAEGFRVYEGGGYGSNEVQDFVPLAKARVSKDERTALAAMEQASAGPRAPSAPEMVDRRPKGKVTVDSGVASSAK